MKILQEVLTSSGVMWLSARGSLWGSALLGSFEVASSVTRSTAARGSLWNTWSMTENMLSTGKRNVQDRSRKTNSFALA